MANLIIISLKHDGRKLVLSRSIERQLVHLVGLQKVDLWCGNGQNSSLEKAASNHTSARRVGPRALFRSRFCTREIGKQTCKLRVGFLRLPRYQKLGDGGVSHVSNVYSGSGSMQRSGVERLLGKASTRSWLKVRQVIARD